MQVRVLYDHTLDAAEPGASSAATINLIGAARGFGRDQAIYGEGEPAEAVYKVVSGAVRLYRVLDDGRRQIIGFQLPGDVFGLEAGAEHRASAEAICKTTLIVARRTSLAAQTGAQELWRLAMVELDRAHEHVLTLGRRDAHERVASFLIDLAERTGAGLALELPMSRQDMADYLGLTIETVSRTLTHLQAEGLIDIAACRSVRLKAHQALDSLRR